MYVSYARGRWFVLFDTTWFKVGISAHRKPWWAVFVYLGWLSFGARSAAWPTKP